jgi:hypothetical protein
MDIAVPRQPRCPTPLVDGFTCASQIQLAPDRAVHACDMTCHSLANDHFNLMSHITKALRPAGENPDILSEHAKTAAFEQLLAKEAGIVVHALRLLERLYAHGDSVEVDRNMVSKLPRGF